MLIKEGDWIVYSRQDMIGEFANVLYVKNAILGNGEEINSWIIVKNLKYSDTDIVYVKELNFTVLTAKEVEKVKAIYEEALNSNNDGLAGYSNVF